MLSTELITVKSLKSDFRALALHQNALTKGLWWLINISNSVDNTVLNNPVVLNPSLSNSDGKRKIFMVMTM